MVKNPPANAGAEKVLWRRKWQPTLVFLPEKSLGQRSLRATVHQVARVRHDWATKHTHACKSSPPVTALSWGESPRPSSGPAEQPLCPNAEQFYRAFAALAPMRSADASAVAHCSPTCPVLIPQTVFPSALSPSILPAGKPRLQVSSRGNFPHPQNPLSNIYNIRCL